MLQKYVEIGCVFYVFAEHEILHALLHLQHFFRALTAAGDIEVSISAAQGVEEILRHIIAV